MAVMSCHGAGTPTQRSFSFASPYPRPMKNVVISGAGPAGLLTAHALLSRGRDYRVSIYESRKDPRLEEVGPRAYSLGLNIRGQYALRDYFGKGGRSRGLWESIEKKGVKSDSFWLHIGKNKFNIRKPAPMKEVEKTDGSNNSPPPTLLIPRNKLTSAMVNELEKQYPDRCEIFFQESLNHVDIFTNTCKSSSGKEEKYDLLVGADGVASIVREAMASSTALPDAPPFKSEDEVLPGGYKVMLGDCPPALDPNSVHAMESTSKEKSGFGLFMIPAPPTSPGKNNTMCTLIAWPKDQPAVIESGSDEEIHTALLRDFPQLETVSMDQVSQLSEQRPSSAKLIRCSRYHDSKVMLIGDAAHSTGGTLGQGANSALLDVVAFDRALDEARGDIQGALEVFSATQVKEGLALWTLLQLKPANLPMPLGPLYSLLQLLRGFRSKVASKLLRLSGTNGESHGWGWRHRVLFTLLRPLLKRPVQTALSQTLTPFSEIVSQNQWWVNMALKKTGRSLALA